MLWTAFILGIGSSLHCVAMCGPITMALPSEASKKTFIVNRVVYNLGRILTYALMGVLLGIFISGISLQEYQSHISIVAGVSLLLMAFFYKRVERFLSGNSITGSGVRQLQKNMRQHMKKTGVVSRFILGMLNGLLPCGMVYFALIGALAQSTIGASAAYMSLFGLGTLPMMLSVAFTTQLISGKVKLFLSENRPVLVGIIALLFVLRGLELGIPYISPEVQMEQDHVESSCCKRK